MPFEAANRSDRRLDGAVSFGPLQVRMASVPISVPEGPLIVAVGFIPRCRDANMIPSRQRRPRLAEIHQNQGSDDLSAYHQLNPSLARRGRTDTRIPGAEAARLTSNVPPGHLLMKRWGREWF